MSKNNDVLRRCRSVIAHHSKSFSLASGFLPAKCRDKAAAVYAWCRYADDAIDLVDADQAGPALHRLREGLDRIYAGAEMDHLELTAFQIVVQRQAVPRDYPEELLAGMAMDAGQVQYETLEQLLRYCFRVAGTVGLMMCHVMGLRDAAARRQAAHLGIAMQLTNICRDVLEDWERGRLYVPRSLLAEAGAPDLAERLGGPFPADARGPMAIAVRRLLREADRYYASGAEGLGSLSFRCSLGIRAALHVYAAIGKRVERNGCDITTGRAIVSRRRKALLLLRALAEEFATLPRRPATGRRPVRDDFAAGRPPLSFPQDVLPV